PDLVTSALLVSMDFHWSSKFPALTLPFFFFFNDTATTEIYTLSLHDALPISSPLPALKPAHMPAFSAVRPASRSEEHTSELQSPMYLVCRLLLEKKNKALFNAPDVFKAGVSVTPVSDLRLY